MSHKSVNTQRPILIIDKTGVLGVPLVKSLSQEQFIIFVSNAKLQNKKIVRVMYGNRIPRIPNNSFSQIIFIDSKDADFADFLPALIEKAKVDKAGLMIIKNVYTLSKNFLHIYNREQGMIKLLLYGDIYSDKYAFPNRLYRLFKELKEKGTLHLLDSGLSLVYPAYFPDVAVTIERLLYAGEKGIYCLFPKKGISEISLGRLLHTVFPDMKLALSEKKSDTAVLIPEGSIETITPTEALQRIEHLPFATLPLEHKIENENIKTERKVMSVLNSCLLTGVMTVVFLCVLPGLFFFLGYLSLTSGVQELQNGQIQLASVSAKTAQQSFSLVASTAVPVNLIGQKIGFFSQVQRLESLTASAEKGTSAFENLSNGIALFSKRQEPSNQTIGLAEVRFADQQIGELIAENALTAFPDATQRQLIQATEGFASLQDSLPDILGLQQTKTYLVLFENSNELRPGGGFIGSYGLLTVANGAIKDFSVQDIYSLDGQLQGHVSPPQPLQQYLGIQNWFLRDSNFAVDQSQNSATENYFYTLESGKTVDGVLTMDTVSLEQLLKLTGPIDVPQYHQQVSDKNFFQIFEDHSEQNFTPGSQQKKAFLSAFSTALQSKLTTHPLSTKTLQSFFIDQVQEKHVSFWLVNQLINREIQNALTTFVVSSPNTSASQDPTVNDFFAVNEANLGLNKVNHYIQRSIDHNVSIDANGLVTHTATVTYKNTSTKNASYGGDYKVFIRGIIPHNAILNAISFNGKDQPFFLTTSNQQPVYKGKTFLPENSLSVYPEDELGGSSYGFFTIIPMGTTVAITFTYSLPQMIEKDEGKTKYQLSLVKQFGTDNDPITVHVQTAKGLNLEQQSFNGVVSPHAAATQFVLNTDKIMSLLVRP